ncbi:TolC family protein [Robiginitomaculum antarcticum]|uniref:TolC family protein n=1 Tax=Robiginitomaculum antarcticum TaxID=437507 RepID=UPI00036DE78D|nr:TolC family protein [Robiginitomaculum antarcticum]
MPKFKRVALCVLIAATFPGVAIAVPCDGADSLSTSILTGVPLTLNMTLGQIRAASPNVRRAALEIRARQSDADQAGRRLNPSIGFEMDNFAGSGPLNGFNQTETTLSIEQTFELGGKRIKRERAVRVGAYLATAECYAVLRETELEAAILFYELQAAYELADLADDSADLSTKLVQIVTKRVEAGAAAPPELSRARVEAAAAKADALTARANVERKRFELAALWGSDNPKFARPLTPVNAAIEQSDRAQDLGYHPLLTVAKGNTELRLAEQDAAYAAGFPDVTVSAGVRQFSESNDSAFIVGVSVPFPIFDRNRDKARASGFRAESSRINASAMETNLRSRQRATLAERRSIGLRLLILEQEALPAAQSAYDASVTGYEAGRFDLTAMLAARKALIETRVSVIHSRRDFNIETMRLHSLISAPPFKETSK